MINSAPAVLEMVATPPLPLAISGLQLHSDIIFNHGSMLVWEQLK